MFVNNMSNFKWEKVLGADPLDDLRQELSFYSSVRVLTNDE